MPGTSNPEILNRLGDLRRSRGLSAAALAKAVEVSRQTIYAIESGTYVPNTTVALRLARTLEASVEELFALSSGPVREAATEAVTVLPDAEPLQFGQPLQLCRVDNRLMASPPSTVRWYLPPADAISASEGAARVFHPEIDFRNRVLVAGCDPGISVLARYMRKSGMELILAHRNSTQALELLRSGSVHIAGTHLRDQETGQSNLPAILQIFRGKSAENEVAVIAFAEWEEGILTASGNPKNIRDIADLARTGREGKPVSLVNRELGSGSRRLLDAQLARLQIAPKRIRGYNSIASGHLAAAWQVHKGAADCCLATRAAARLFGLGFVPLVSERYDLAIRRRHVELPAIQMLIDTLNRSAFRRELESVGGYDTRVSGTRIL